MEIITQLTGDKTGQALAIKFQAFSKLGVGKSAMTLVKNNSDLITMYAHSLDSEEGSSYHKTMKEPQSVLSDDEFTWFLPKRGSWKPGPFFFLKDQWD